MRWQSETTTEEASLDTNLKISISRRKNLELMITMDKRRKLGRIEKKIGTMPNGDSFLPPMISRRHRSGLRSCSKFIKDKRRK